MATRHLERTFAHAQQPTTMTSSSPTFPFPRLHRKAIEWVIYGPGTCEDTGIYYKQKKKEKEELDYPTVLYMKIW